MQYADPVKRAFAMAAPNDPFYSQQWSLNDPLSGVNAESAWALQPDSSSVVVAVVDTGILPHPDLVGRVLDGYDFITDPARARDSNARDPDPRDEGDWSTGECGSPQESFFHGLFVAGQIAANTNNGIGIAGLSRGSRILPVRVLGRCGGTFDDILAGMLWASGVQIAGVPPNTNPAKVINLSLGGFGGCDSVHPGSHRRCARAGRRGRRRRRQLVIGCRGLHARKLQRRDHRRRAPTRARNSPAIPTSARRIDVSAPGGDLPDSGLIISTSNDGTTAPQNPDYVAGRGTSFAAPLVSGTAALMIARNPLITAGRVLDIVTGTHARFPVGIVLAGQRSAERACSMPARRSQAPCPADRAAARTRTGGRVLQRRLDHYFITADAGRDRIPRHDFCPASSNAPGSTSTRTRCPSFAPPGVTTGVPVLCAPA